MTSLFRLAVIAGCIACAATAEFPTTVTVGPGTNAAKDLAANAAPGDVITVTFRPASGYAIASADVDDPDHLGWLKNGTTFKLLVSAGVAPGSKHSANFHGTLTPLTSGTGGGVITWDMTGRYSVLGSHQGVGDDNRRNPVGGLVSSKPGGAPMDDGFATWDPVKRTIEGTLHETNSTANYMGFYADIPAVAAAATATATQLGAATPGPCPEGDGVTVQFVYFGCPASGDGGQAKPDAIHLNDFHKLTPDAQKALDAANQAKAKADQDLAAADKAVDDAQKALDAAKKALAAAIDKAGNVVAAQARVAAVTSALAVANKAKADADKALADLLARKPPASKAAIQRAQAAAALAAQLVKQGDDALARANDALEKARQQAQNSAAAKAAQKKVDDATAAVAAATAKRDAAQKVDDAAEVAQKTATDAAADAAFVDSKWDEARAKTLTHEQGHRTICYFFADKLTDMLNHLNVWGYAQDAKTAAALGSAQFANVRTREVLKIQTADRAMQAQYDGTTDHGSSQGKWDWGNLK